ncbi:hypothetical protein ACH5RR_015825 [Cinchona calisaya]|uniref:Uncharacterized protein n=1 Tax=Cinchona calisaya TaxID=153742 RepID=A0ABD2ZU60_9GENT
MAAGAQTNVAISNEEDEVDLAPAKDPLPVLFSLNHPHSALTSNGVAHLQRMKVAGAQAAFGDSGLVEPFRKVENTAVQDNLVVT